MPYVTLANLCERVALVSYPRRAGLYVYVRDELTTPDGSLRQGSEYVLQVRLSTYELQLQCKPTERRGTRFRAYPQEPL